MDFDLGKGEVKVNIEVKEFQLEPHGWKAIVSSGVRDSEDNNVECKGHVNPLDDIEKKTLLEQLAESAYLVYTLMENKPLPPEEAAILIPFATEMQVTCTCESEVCEHAEAARIAAASWAAREPLALLSLLGITRTALLDSVFGSWAAESEGKALPGAALLQRPAARAGGNVSAIMDYIAESVQDSALHKPGHRLTEVELRLKAPSKMTPPPKLASLLPQAPTDAALTHLREQMSKRATEWAPHSAQTKSGSKTK